MNWLRRIGRRVRFLFREDQVESELSEEILNHVAMEADELVRDGWDPDHAHREALRRFGGETRTKEQVRDARGGRLLADLVQDVRYALRGLRKSPGFTVSVLLVLTLGIGASTALFSIVNAVILRPLPYPDPDELVRAWPAVPAREEPRDLISYLNFEDWRERTEAFDQLGSYLPPFLPEWPLIRDGDPIEQVTTTWIGGDFFGVLGVQPQLGRWIEHADIDETRPVAVVSHRSWLTLFGGDPTIVGRTVTLNYQSVEIVGVMPQGFSFPDPGVDFWMPMTVGFAGSEFPMIREARGISTLNVIGRLADWVAPEVAEAELTAIARELEETYPESNRGKTAAIVDPLHETLVSGVRSSLWSLLGAVGFFLILAVTNTANLFLARSTERQGELALRRSLGASSGRIVRQLTAESTLLAMMGGVLGLGLASVLVGAVRVATAEVLPRIETVGVDATAAIVTLLGVGLFTIFAGVVPAVGIARSVSSGAAHLSETREIGGGVSGVKRRRALVAGEVGLAVLLLVGAALLIRSFERLSAVDPGFTPEGAIAMTLTISNQRYPDPAAMRNVYQQITERIQALPGVTAAGVTAHLPIRSIGLGFLPTVPGLYEPPADERREARAFATSAGAFEALGMTLLRGRGFSEADGADDPPVAIVDERMIAEFFGGQDPIGRRLVAGDPYSWEVVGVARNVDYNGASQPSGPAFYVPVAQDETSRQFSFVVRSDGDLRELAGPLRAIVDDIDPELPIAEIIPLSRLAAETTALPRLFASVMSAFAALALFLAVMGVYGVIAHIVRARTREMGLRSALGASKSQILRHVFRGGMAPVVTGLVGGLIGAGLLSRYLESLLFGVEPLDPASFAIAGVTLAVAAAFACAVPAYSAAKVDPMASLKGQ